MALSLNKVGGSALAKMEDLNSEKQIRVKEKNALDEETYTNVSIFWFFYSYLYYIYTAFESSGVRSPVTQIIHGAPAYHFLSGRPAH